MPQLFYLYSNHKLTPNLQGTLSKLKLEFSFEIQCFDILFGDYLLGTTQGLYHLDKLGKLTLVIPTIPFYQIQVAYPLGVLLAINGKRNKELRMFSLVEIAKVSKAGVRLKSFPFLTICKARSFTLSKIKNQWYLTVCLKKKVVLYLWDYFPHYRFLIIKEWNLKDKGKKAILMSEKEVPSQIYVQLLNKYIQLRSPQITFLIWILTLTKRFSQWICIKMILIPFYVVLMIVDFMLMRALGCDQRQLTIGIISSQIQLFRWIITC